MIRRQRQARSAPSALPGNLLAGAVICLLGIFLQHSEVLATSGVVVGWGKYAVNGDLRGGLIAINSGTHDHILGIREDGSILAWGDDGYGACNVPLPNSDFVAVSAGGTIQGSHSLGLRSDGSVVAWGDNSYGQCDVPEPNAGFVSISAGHRHSLGLKNDGSIVAWGSSDFGECNVPLPNTDFRAVSAGFLFSVGLKSDSTIVVWGHSGLSDLPEPNAGFVAISAGTTAAMALRVDGTIAIWGYPGYVDVLYVPEPNADFIAVAAGHLKNLGLKSAGTIVAWGADSGAPQPNSGFVAVDIGGPKVGLRADGSYAIQHPRADSLLSWYHNAPAGMRDAVSVGAGLNHAVALRSDGSLLAWGSSVLGVLDLPLPNADYLAIAVGRQHTLALRRDGTIAAWGDNQMGQCNVPEYEPGYAAIAAGSIHSLAVGTDGSVVAWGGNFSGQCNVPAANEDYVAVAAGGAHSLGLKRNSSIVAWGNNGVGQCDVPAPNADFVAVAARANHSLGLKSDGRIVAWGDNGQGQCNVPAPNAGFVAMACGTDHNMALRADGTVVVWGADSYRQQDVLLPNASTLAIAAGEGFCVAVRGLDDPTPPDHLVFSEVVVASGFDGSRQRGSDCFEIVNPTSVAVDLSDVHVTDAGDSEAGVFYYDIVRRGGAGGGGVGGRFHARFPAGSVLAAGDTIVVSVAGSWEYFLAYGRLPDYELYEDFTSPDLVPELVEVFPGSIGFGLGSGGGNRPDLSADSGTLVLYRWDGVSDLVQDLDYVTWGSDPRSRVDKTGVVIDGPDADEEGSAYPADTPVTEQVAISGLPHAQGGSYRRRGVDEEGEATAGGNGATGHRETSEPLAMTWSGELPPTPAAAPAVWTRTSPIVLGWEMSPAVPLAGQAVSVELSIVSRDALQVVPLYWSLASGPYTLVLCTPLGGGRWGAQLPGQAAGAQVSWYVSVFTTAGAITTSPVGAPVYVHGYTVAPLPPLPPVFAGVELDPAAPYGGAATTVSAVFGAAGSAPDQVSVYFGVDGGAYAELPASVSGDVWSVSIPPLVAGAQVRWYVEAVNGGGRTCVPAGAPAEVNSYRVRDIAPPTGTLLSGSGVVGAAATITAVLVDDVGVTQAWLHYRAGGAALYDSVAMEPSGPVYTGQVAASAIGVAGLQYYVSAADGDGNLGYLPAGASASQPANLPVLVSSHPVFTLGEQQYRLGGIPLRAGGGAPDSVFAGLGPYDPVRWRYLTLPYDSEEGYREHPQAAAATAGRGFWIVSRQERTIGVGGWSSRLDRDFVIALEQGWNLVSNPFAFAVDTSSVVFPAGTSRDLIGHDASGYAHEHGLLEPGRGYFLWHGGAAGAELRVRPVGAVDGATKSGGVSRALLASDEEGWSVELTASCGVYADRGTRLGVRAGATAGLDGFDLRQAPPPPGGYVSLSLVGEQGVCLHTDYRAEGSAGETWTLRLMSDQVGQPFTVGVGLDRPLPAGWQLVAVDMSDLGESLLWSGEADAGEGGLSGRVVSASCVKTWRLFAGEAAYVQTARQAVREEFNAGIVAFALGPIWPNPLRTLEGAVVRLAAPQAGQVSLRVYDLRGRLVARVHEGQLARGLHQFVWNGTDTSGQRVSSGIYLVRLQAPGVRLVQKATVLR